VALALVGLSHRVAPIGLRERVRLDAGAAADLARSLGDAVCLSTCNRTEIYLAGGDGGSAAAALVELAGEPVARSLYRKEDEEAALHLFRVAAGLDSLVLGEGEILGQVRRAYESVPTGRTLDRVFRQALRVGKRVRSETGLGERPASVSSVAAALARQVHGGLTGRRVMLVGAGAIAEQAASDFASRGATIAFVANRTVASARRLAAHFGGAALSLGDVPAHLAEVDVLVSSTSAGTTILHAGDFPARRRGRLFLIDLAVPRDLDPAIGALDGCILYDIDDLAGLVAETLAERNEDITRAELLVAEEAERFRAWHASLGVVPAIASLRARADEIRASELAKLEGRVTANEQRTLELVTAQMLNKLLHLPTVRLKEAAPDSGELYADAVRHLFGLA
jgi:glutamyl-tRNA reductase